MNERIKQLADQAGYTEAGYESDDGPFVPAEFNKEKFAELIVQDGIKQILEWKNEPFPFDEHTAVWILKKHFGIEE
jgi:hypothetical protein